jgi:hypothetical protein
MRIANAMPTRDIWDALGAAAAERGEDGDGDGDGDGEGAADVYCMLRLVAGFGL